MRKTLQFIGFVCAIALIISCQKEVSQEVKQPSAKTSSVLSINILECGTPYVSTIENFSQQAIGNIVISNDASKYYFNINETEADYQIEEVRWYYGTEAHILSALQGYFQCGVTPGTGTPDLIKNYNPGQDSAWLSVPIDTLSCIYFHADIYMVRRAPDGTILNAYWAWTNDVVGRASQNDCSGYDRYCKQTCPPPPGCGQLRTQTQGGWGAEPNGNNSGTYLHANFASAFPSGLKVGCVGGYTVTLTSAQAITNLLPTGGTAAVLSNNYIDPAQIKNVLAGQVVALSLSAGFDQYDANFGQAGIKLGDMIIGSGTFAGKTVSQFLAIANDVLGGCSNDYTPAQVNETASKINENYVDGIINGGYLVCPN